MERKNWKVFAERQSDSNRSSSGKGVKPPTNNVLLTLLLLSITTLCRLTVATSTLNHDIEVAECANSNTGDCALNGGDEMAASPLTPNDEHDTSLSCYDADDRCERWAKRMECENNPDFMLNYCQKSCGVCLEMFDMGPDQVAQGNQKDNTIELIRSSEYYLRNRVLKDKKYAKVRARCRNDHELCSFWAVIGECDNNPTYMKDKCALACQSCELLDFNLRCPLDPNAVDALKPGDLNEMFERITDKSEGSEYAKYEPVIHSRPYPHPKGDVDYREGPWVVTFDNFLTDEECDRLVVLGGERGYERSTNVGSMKEDGTSKREVSKTRTSENAWCQGECYDDPLQKDVVNRIANITGIPEINQENLQLLRYNVGQFYRSHHDYIPHQRHRQQGPRVLTFFLYLNDVEEGGGTRFNDLDITIMPKKGKALLWPSVINANPNEKEERTMHEALPVEKGVKFGANAWIHLRDAKTPNKNNCQ